MEYSLALDRSKSRNNSLNALKKVEKIVQSEGRTQSFLNSDILAYPEEINYGLFLRTESSAHSLHRSSAESFQPIRQSGSKLDPVPERPAEQARAVCEAAAPPAPPAAAAAPPACEEKELGRFGRVIQLLARIFKIEHVDEQHFQLEDFERQVLAAIFKRKYAEALNVRADGRRLAAQIACIVRKSSKKRPEEKYKFIFKRAFKVLKEQFGRQTKCAGKARAEATERAFYEFYFSAYALRNGLPLEKYFNPKNSTAKNANYHKTISIEYVNLIRESPVFVSNFMLALELLVRECDAFIDGKLRGLGLRFAEFQAKRGDDCLDDICHYVARNAKCKLPWTKHEVLEAVDIVKKLFF